MKVMAEALSHERLRVRFRGAVQGVGFRPFLHRMAALHGISGFVLNDPDGVLAEIEGSRLSHFLEAVRLEQPPLARIDAMEVTQLRPECQPGFVIRESAGPSTGAARIGPDAATCTSCLEEMFDPCSRFHLYPFITCTDCGPRFTISGALPYDRPTTAMAGFTMCPDCAAEYANPGGRRFHAETIVCAVCGPQLSRSMEDMAQILRSGGIVALKGIGGFQLFCDATNDTAVQRLRARKKRPEKPFAVMVADASAAGRVGVVGQVERALLRHTSRPIVMLRSRDAVAASVAPGLNCISVMLPAAPVHHLLFDAITARNVADVDRPALLVATSGNRQGDPIVIDDDEAERVLADLADLVVPHSRPIFARADDSVMSVIAGAPFFIRRARAFVPEPIDLGADGPPVLAVGGHLKATLCVTRGREAFVSQHVGDLGSPATMRFYQDTAHRLLAMLNVAPQIVGCDLHPDYRSTIFAESFGLPVARVQHHAAHVASVAAEHRAFNVGNGKVFGVALDGHGYGDDGGAWGGELLLFHGATWRRYGHLLPLALPGGDRAAQEPWRMAVSALAALGREAEAGARFPEHSYARQVARMVALGGGVPITTSTTTSLGRLFDAASTLLGVCTRQSYEGQAAMELEAAADGLRVLPRGYVIKANVLDFRPLLKVLLAPGMTARKGARLFHGTLVAGLAAWIGQAADDLAVSTVFLGGGCLANRLLTEGLVAALRARGLTPLLPRAVPANDGGLSLGQAAVARAQEVCVTLR